MATEFCSSQSLHPVESAKLHGLDPEAYLAHVIDRLARGHLASKLGELLP
jgi:transposase